MSDDTRIETLKARVVHHRERAAVLRAPDDELVLKMPVRQLPDNFFSKAQVPTPWMTAKEAAAYAKTGQKLIYREVAARRLRAARVGGRRDLRFLAEWIDEWLIRSAEPLEIK